MKNLKIYNNIIIIIIIIINISNTKNENLTSTECESDFICRSIDFNSYCDLENKECECLADFSYNTTLNECKIKNYLNISCTLDKECSKYEKNGICDGFGSCVCPIGFSWNFENFICEFDKFSTIENLMCGTNEEICLKNDKNSFCHNFYCKCNKKFHFDLKSLKCVNNIKKIKINFYIFFIIFLFIL